MHNLLAMRGGRMTSVAEWLQSLGLERYADVFARNDVDLAVLPALTDADLQQLGLSLGHRRKLLAAVAAGDFAVPDLEARDLLAHLYHLARRIRGAPSTGSTVRFRR